MNPNDVSTSIEPPWNATPSLPHILLRDLAFAIKNPDYSDEIQTILQDPFLLSSNNVRNELFQLLTIIPRESITEDHRSAQAIEFRRVLRGLVRKMIEYTRDTKNYSLPVNGEFGKAVAPRIITILRNPEADTHETKIYIRDNANHARRVSIQNALSQRPLIFPEGTSEQVQQERNDIRANLLRTIVDKATDDSVIQPDHL